ncbi:site-specific integrase [Enterococcus hirae]
MPKISNIYQDKKSEKWYFVANLGFDEEGKRIRKWGRGFTTQKEAKLAYDEYMNDFSKTAIRQNSTMTYKKFLGEYFLPDYKQRVRKRTYENRLSSMDKHLPYFYRYKLSDISAPIIKKWQNQLSKNYSSAYIRNIYGLFQMSLDLAVKLGLITNNTAKIVGNVKKQKQKVDFWTLDEFHKVIATFDTTDYYELYTYVSIYFLFMTGLRMGEAQALEWSDLDWENETIRIEKSMFYKNAQEFYYTEPKTRASIRTIALDNDLIELLSEWKANQDHNGESKYILSYNGLPTNKHTLRHVIKRHSELANVHNIKIHALRHSHASLLISLGINALDVRDRLGHEDIETTLGTYGHLYPHTNREVANKLTGIIIQQKNEVQREKKFSGNQYIKKAGK